MAFRLIIAACFIVGFASQFFLLLKVKKTLPRLCPSIFVLVAGIYSALRMFGIISYPGALVGIVLMIFVAALAAGCVAGALVYLIVRTATKKKAAQVSDKAYRAEPFDRSGGRGLSAAMETAIKMKHGAAAQAHGSPVRHKKALLNRRLSEKTTFG